MNVNEANWDRAVRVVVGLGLLALAFVGPRTPWGFVGVVPLATGLCGFCPLYRLVGAHTASGDERPGGQ